MSHPDKFPTLIWWDNADKAADFAARMASPSYVWTPADADWIAGTAGNYRDARYHASQSTPIPTTPPSIGFTTLPWFASPEGQVNATTVTEANGKISCSAGSGGVQCWISLDPTFPSNPSLTSVGAGATGYLYPSKGQTFYFKQVGAATQQMRASMEPNN